MLPLYRLELSESTWSHAMKEPTRARKILAQWIADLHAQQKREGKR
jgi:hypothetical protein